MTIRRNPYVEIAIQYLTWAIEEIEKAGNQKAAQHARAALEAPQEGIRRSSDGTDKRPT